MTNRHCSYALIASLLLGVVLSGCSTIDSSIEEPLPSPADLQAPEWHVGDHWNYINEEGRWQNRTVEAIEEKNGLSSYRIHIRYSKPDEVGVVESTIWLASESLGLVWVSDRILEGGCSPPAWQLFPMVPRVYKSECSFANYSQFDYSMTTNVSEWKSITVPAGEYDAVHIFGVDANTGQQSEDWYSPQAQNLVRFDAYEPYELVSWNRS